LALKSDGSVWSWGDNGSGQLGIGTTPTKSLSPVQTQNLSAMTAIAAVGYQNLAVNVNGSLFGWGANSSGQLGNPAPTTETTPALVRDFLLTEDPDHDGLVNWKEYTLGGNPDAFSTVNDTISDSWKAGYNLSLSDPNVAASDPTDKGLTVLQDYQLGTDPTKFSFVDDGIADGWKFSYGFNLFDTTLATKDVNGQGLTALAFYQSTFSTLHDGIPDSWKTQWGFDPTDPTVASRDEDSDGLSNYEEYLAGTDPYNRDTDGDGVEDGIDGWPNEGTLSPPRLPAVRYAVIDLGANRYVGSINNPGQILGGDASTGSGFIWQNGRETIVAYPGKPRINSAGEFIDYYGYYHRADGTTLHVDVKEDGQDPNLFDFNDGGVIVGSIIYGAAYPCEGTADDFHLRWYDFSVTPPYIWQAIANDGSVGGYTQRQDGNYNLRKAVVSRDGSSGIELGTLRGSDNASFILSMIVRNGAAFALGDSINTPANSEHGFLWHDASASPDVRGSGMIDLGTLPGARSYLGGEINQRLEIAGVTQFAVVPSIVNKNVATLWRNGRPIDLNLLIDNPHWSLQGVDTINDQGLIGGYGTLDGTLHAALLVPAELMVDANRDGQMSFDDPVIHDADLTTKDKPYRFWVNDDDDTELNYNGTPSEEEIVPPSQADWRGHQIVSKRNLEDFARLWIYFGGLHEGITSGNIQVGLRWKNVTSGTSPAINIYASADGEGSDSYIKNDTAAQAQIGDPIFNEAVREKYGVQTIYIGTRYIFKPDYWTGLNANNPKKCLLFEGAGEGKGELEIVFYDQNEIEIGSGGSVWLDLKNIKKLYERAVATPDPLTPLPYQSGNSAFNDTDITYSPDVSPRFDEPVGEEPQCLVFVHGWRMSYYDSVSFSETMFKRLWWAGYKGRFAAFRWATQTSADSYNTSEWLAWKYGKSLANYIENYLKNQLPSYTINVAAHSMGNIVTGSALARGMHINNYMLMEAAIPSGCYVDSVNDYAPFLEAEQTRHATPDIAGDNGYRLYLESFTTNVGKFVSFFNVNDFALATGSTFPVGHTNWEQNQIDYKPNHFSNITLDYYDFFPNEPTGRRSVFFFGGTDTRLVTDPHETMAFIARPRSKATGAEPHSASMLGQLSGTAINLHQLCGFDSDQSDHSGQFSWRIQQLGPFYDRIVEELTQ
jgi:Regulator of chromosome condensation (RCC1) repeat/Alpha/beta hydrolase of unknown function (DUF900)